MIIPKKLGILGGMGPYASCDWYKKILDICQRKFNLSQDYEYPEINIISVQMSGWSERGIEDSELAKACLMKGVDKLTQLRMDYIIIACNTVHFYFDDIQHRTVIPVINMIDFCCSSLPKNKKVSVLSSQTTSQLNLYSDGLANKNIDEIKLPKSNQSDVNSAVLLCQRGKFSDAKKILTKLVGILRKEGADIVVLGCTELPLAINQEDSDVLLVDPGYLLLDHVTDLLYENVPSVNV